MSLASSLLGEAVADDDEPTRRWAYPLWALALVSVFLLYHVAVLTIHNTPTRGLASGVRAAFDQKLYMHRYMRTTGLGQTWSMFAPDPYRSNHFMKVQVRDLSGEMWDLHHAHYGRRSYPYLVYDRMAKINRRILDTKSYRVGYAAWVCRQWERTHDGEQAAEVQFMQQWTVIPSPDEVVARSGGRLWRMGFDPAALKLSEHKEGWVSCAHTPQAQLTDEQLSRYGIEQRPGRNKFRPIFLRTWAAQEQD